MVGTTHPVNVCNVEHDECSLSLSLSLSLSFSLPPFPQAAYEMLHTLKGRDRLFNTNTFSKVHLTHSLRRPAGASTGVVVGPTEARGAGRRKSKEVLATDLSKCRAPSCTSAVDMLGWFIDVSLAKRTHIQIHAHAQPLSSPSFDSWM